MAAAVVVSAASTLPALLDLAPADDTSPHGLAAVEVQHAAEDARLRETTIDPFDDAHPAIAGLDADLRAAVQAVARDAHERGVDLWVTSGLRTAAMQQDLLDDAVREHGSLAEARRFVATPEGSSHVTGHAVDIGPTDGADWVVRRGARYGLCQTYANEMWHFELATEPGGECPEQLPDAG
ncbi:M15 family metallopeptidase [Cellulomonas sp. NPDC055163]